jgi:hypothetical protein
MPYRAALVRYVVSFAVLLVNLAPTNAISAIIRLDDINANGGAPVSMYVDRLSSSLDGVALLSGNNQASLMGIEQCAPLTVCPEPATLALLALGLAGLGFSRRRTK